ncbi:uncharacterized protein LOC100677838 [Nasonia vitripennis]|uniref:Uncharacterized protein n=1 Tax=Nasonia vitripennis TaxID=7425 RepID=A0A7M7M271_NASVI|nr:uncharacterized protein LOC100677838 [Nasonia vitripennis]
MTKDAFVWDFKLSQLSMLRNNINNVLLYFHWHQCKERTDDHFYLQKIADILVIYVNLELKLLKSTKTSASQLSNTLLTALYIYLDKSEEHIFKVFFKSHLKDDKKICLWMLGKYFSNIAENKLQLTSVMFVRYILAFKLWKSLSDNQEELKKINSLAMKIMGSTMPSLCLKNLHFIKQPPKKYINTTMWYHWYLRTKSFDLETAIESFIKYEENLYNLATSEESSLDIIKNNTRCNCHIQVEDVFFKRTNKCTKLQKQKMMKKKQKLKVDEIIFIDLTKEENLITNKKKRNLKWLQLLKMRDLLECSKNTQKMDMVDSLDNSKNPNAIVRSSINEVTKSYEFDFANSSDPSCDNSRFNDVSILTDFNGIFSNGDIIKNKGNQNIETNKTCSISNDLFDDYICDMSIDSRLLNIDISTENNKELTPSLLDFNLSGMDSLSNDFSYSSIEAIDSHLSKKDVTDANSSIEDDKPYNALFCKDSLLSFNDNKNQLLTELTDLKLCEDDDKNFLSLNEESLITSTNSSTDPFILGLNPDIDEFSKPLLMEKYNLTSSSKEYPIFVSDLEYWKKKLLKTNSSREKTKETIIIQQELNGEIFADSEENSEKKKKRCKRKKHAEINEDNFNFQLETNDYAEFFNDMKHWKKKILKTNNSPMKIKECDIKEESNFIFEHFQPSEELKRKQLRRKRLSAQKMKNSELCLINNNKKRKTEDKKIITQNESTAKSNDKAVLQFLHENFLPKFTRISSFQLLANCIKSKKADTIITIFDSDSSLISQIKNDEVKPSSSHYFIRLLCKNRLLLHHYTESKGTLERQAGISPEKLITLPESDHDLLYQQLKCNIPQADLVIIFTNNMSSISKWLKGKPHKLFIIQEKAREMKSLLIKEFSPDLKFFINTELEVIQTENYDKGCQLLAENLGWSEELKKYEEIA